MADELDNLKESRPAVIMIASSRAPEAWFSGLVPVTQAPASLAAWEASTSQAWKRFHLPGKQSKCMGIILQRLPAGGGEAAAEGRFLQRQRPKG